MFFKIPGIDNLVVNRIKERTSKQVVFQSEKTKIAEDKSQENKQNKQRKKRHYNKEDMEKAIRDLNELLAEKNTPLAFEMVEEKSRWHIRIIDTSKQKVLHVNVSPEKVMEMLTAVEKSTGAVIDETV
ncbi:flagellar protein FlaG [Metallumcola ferriviriculae]|uniref:Flagellar protein FlaG n=1 Tax=Metallumcola ferriviriculae TaxID=3039180 RepID=A0AAU0USM2_9FIRM|nr:flagellar protein FlaG [Desulfitibacteraceae bacterium MK1]